MNVSTDDCNDLALYVVATPIGNLNDLTARASSVLSQVSLVAAEDTRHSRTLLAHIGSSARLIAAHTHNERASADQVVTALRNGERCALISDAGTPAISDPGARLVHIVQEAGFRVVPIPGVSAPICLLSVSGIDADRFGSAADRFYFAGFLPARENARISALRELPSHSACSVLFESPHRIQASAQSIINVFGPDRDLVIGRELTKKFEQIVTLTSGELPIWLETDSNRLRGEFVLVIAPPRRSEIKNTEPINAATEVEIQMSAGQLLAHLQHYLSASQASKLAKRLTGLDQSALYQLTIDSRRDRESDN